MKNRLLAVAQRTGEDYHGLLVRYVLERLLYRLGGRPEGAGFVVKGGLLLGLWDERPYRATRDLDLTAPQPLPEAEVVRRLRALLAGPGEPEDGVVFHPETLAAVPIRAGRRYGGVRLTAQATLGRSRLPVQVDVGFGDAVAAQVVAWPVLLADLPAPRVAVYPPEAVVAEKFHSLVELGLLTSRMKDLHDLWRLAGRFPFEGTVLAQAVARTFARRRTALPPTTPVGLTAEFAADSDKRRQWQAYLRRQGLAGPELAEATAGLATWLEPIRLALLGAAPLPGRWDPGTRRWNPASDGPPPA